jgi:hypothetical protein
MANSDHRYRRPILLLGCDDGNNNPRPKIKMNTLSFSDLTERQLTQVAYLFADQHFGTDAAAFTYELDKNGDVKSRSRIVENNSAADPGKPRARKGASITIHMIEEVNITDELIRHASMSTDALAASIAQRIHQSQPIEVEN